MLQNLLNQNHQLQKSIQGTLQQIQKQKEINSQHQSQIQTLLKFNQRLLGIIQTELNNNQKGKDNVSLQPISQRSQRQSDLVGAPIQSMIKTRKLVAMSERGAITKDSLIQRNYLTNNLVNLYDKEMLRSEIEPSLDLEESQRNLNFSKKPSPSPQSVRSDMAQLIEDSNSIKAEMNNQIKEFRKFASDTNKFYDGKSSQLRMLGSKMSNCFKPIEQINKIAAKINLSAETTNLVKHALMKFNS